jgi:hypothetical protein
MSAITLEVEHSRTGQRRACEYLETLATLQEKRRARARALVLRWPSVGGEGVFDLASGWGLWSVGTHPWRLTDDARTQARAIAAAEGLELPRIRRDRPRRTTRPRAFLTAATARRVDRGTRPETVDPRQMHLRLPPT